MYHLADKVGKEKAYNRWMSRSFYFLCCYLEIKITVKKFDVIVTYQSERGSELEFQIILLTTWIVNWVTLFQINKWSIGKYASCCYCFYCRSGSNVRSFSLFPYKLVALPIWTESFCCVSSASVISFSSVKCSFCSMIGFKNIVVKEKT